MNHVKKRILVIEDEPDVCRILAYRLEKEGFHVTTAYDGEEGLRKARTQKPDLIILDLMLPSMSGEEVCKAIREDDDAAVHRIPVIILTAKDSLTDKIIGKVIGGTVYMTKPYEFDELLAEIRKL